MRPETVENDSDGVYCSVRFSSLWKLAFKKNKVNLIPLVDLGGPFRTFMFFRSPMLPYKGRSDRASVLNMLNDLKGHESRKATGLFIMRIEVTVFIPLYMEVKKKRLFPNNAMLFGFELKMWFPELTNSVHAHGQCSGSSVVL